MIPYIKLPTLHLPFGMEISPFSVTVAIGLLTGASLAARAARWYGPGDDTPLQDVVPWALIGGLMGAHWLHVLGYHPELLREQGVWVLLRFWDGISSMGGVLGSVAGIWIMTLGRAMEFHSRCASRTIDAVSVAYCGRMERQA